MSNSPRWCRRPARKNLLPNGSFEVGPAGWTSMGTGLGWGDLHRLHGAIESTGGQHGRNFLRIPLGGGQTPVLSFDYYEPVVKRELRPLAASRGWIRVDKGEAYTLSCFMRASKDATPALLGARAKDPAGASRDHNLAVKLTTEWKRYALTFRPQQRYVFVYTGPDLPEEQRVDVDLDSVQLEKGTDATTFTPPGTLEFGIEPAASGGIFFDNEDRSLILRAANHGDAAAKLTVHLSATDYLDAPAALPDQSLEIPARSNVQRPVKLPPDWRGYYRIVASADGGVQPLPTDVRLAIVPRRTGADSVLGVNHAFVSTDLIRLAAKAGVTWYRDWSLKWQHIEPSKGQYRWEAGDAQIDRVLRERAFVLPLLPPFPSANWSSEAPAGLPTTGYPGVRIRQAFGPRDPTELAGFISQAVSRYKDRIHIWDFLNEPIYTDYSLPADPTNRYGGRKYSPADYVALLEVAATAMRKADPTCKVIGGIGSGPTHLTRQVIDAGILKQIDIFNLHMYPGLRAPETFAADMAKLLAMMDAHGGRKPIWITEFAYYGADDLSRRPFQPADNSWAEARLLDSERQCADYTVRFFVVSLARSVQKVFLHAGSNGKANEADVDCPLLVHGTPRKLLPALAVLTELLGPAPTCVGERNLTGPDCCVAFETPERSILVFWQTTGDGSKPTLPAGPGLTWLDTMGRKLPGPPAKLSSSPVYLLAPAGKAKELLR
ncbi:MAG: endo-1,4-beta-xylanase [Tepidisphaerales bacterium]